jgi:hypothetical protein
MALLRFRYAYIIVAVLRSTALRRVVDGSPAPRRCRRRGRSSSLHPDVNTVRPHPLGCGRSVLTSGPLRLLIHTQAPHLWCVASKSEAEGSRCRGLTSRSTSSPVRWRYPAPLIEARFRLTPALSLYVGQLFGDPFFCHLEQIDASYVAAVPAVAPPLHHPVT